MSADILVDTGPLYALADPSDQYHERAHEELAAVQKGGMVVIHYAVLCEAYTLIMRRLGGAYARQWLAEILSGAMLVNPEPHDYASAAAQLDKFHDHAITLVDAVSAAVSRRLKLRIWSFDKHFTIMGVKLWR